MNDKILYENDFYNLIKKEDIEDGNLKVVKKEEFLEKSSPSIHHKNQTSPKKQEIKHEFEDEVYSFLKNDP